MINRLLTRRLLDFCDPYHVLGLPRDLQVDGVKPLKYSDKRGSRYDRGRIRAFVDALQRGSELDPIEVDNLCCNGHVLPEPILLDGNHRLIAHVIAGRESIPCRYSGRVDLLRYLEGKRKTCPQG